MEKNYKVDLNKAWKLSKLWKNLAIMWRVFDHLFAIISFIASVSAIYISASDKNDPNIIIILSSIAAALTLMGFALNPAKYMTNYRAAFDLLNAALITNIDENGNLIDGNNSWSEIASAIIKGEAIIDKVYDFSMVYVDDDVKKP